MCYVGVVNTVLAVQTVYYLGEETSELVERAEELGYFNTVEYMLRRLARILVREKYDAGEIKTLREHIEELRKMREELRSLLKGE